LPVRMDGKMPALLMLGVNENFLQPPSESLLASGARLQVAVVRVILTTKNTA
jgi:hypothetical protein